jgi:hypothetical protein
MTWSIPHSDGHHSLLVVQPRVQAGEIEAEQRRRSVALEEYLRGATPPR